MQSYGEQEAIILKIKSCFLRKVMIMSHKIVQDYKILKYENNIDYVYQLCYHML